MVVFKRPHSGLTMDTSSCSVGMPFGVLGHMESGDSISIDPDKTKAVMDSPG